MHWATAVVLLVSCVTIQVSEAYQSFGAANVKKAGINSQFNDFIGNMAADGDETTCAVAGIGFETKFKLELNSPVTIGKLKIMGKGNLNNFKIDIGNSTFTERCARWIAGPTSLENPGLEVQCRIKLTGDVITMEIPEASKSPEKISICEIKYE